MLGVCGDTPQYSHRLRPRRFDVSVAVAVLNWAKCLFAEHTSDSSTNYDSFLN